MKLDGCLLRVHISTGLHCISKAWKSPFNYSRHEWKTTSTYMTQSKRLTFWLVPANKLFHKPLFWDAQKHKLSSSIFPSDGFALAVASRTEWTKSEVWPATSWFPVFQKKKKKTSNNIKSQFTTSNDKRYMYMYMPMRNHSFDTLCTCAFTCKREESYEISGRQPQYRIWRKGQH